jgi:alpha-beta hydrolase superfamily lysophospholipase
MRADTLTFKADDEKSLFVRRFRPDPGVAARAAVHIAHGMSEHSGRYARLAEALVGAGYAVYANDHRGHGRTAEPSDLGWLGQDGFRRAVRDLVELVGWEKEENPGTPAVILGHSMGSYMTQALLVDHGSLVSGAVLSGTGGKPSLVASLGRIVARAERRRVGPRAPSPLLQTLTFGQFNKAFRPNRTAFDWLSRDATEVDKYIADPLCGFAVSTQLWVDMLDALTDISRPDRQANVPHGTPVYVFCGSEDPVGERTKSVEQLLGAYRRAGLRDVTHKFYPGARHETLNETNRDEVTRDLISWLDSRCSVGTA